MLRSKPDVGNNSARVDQVFKKRLLRREWADRHHSLPAQISATLPGTIYGLAPMILRKTTTTTARKAATTISKVHKKICHAPIAARRRPQSGVVICVARWSAMHAACTINCMESIDRTQCVAIRSTLVDDVQRVISQTEEVSGSARDEKPNFDHLIYFAESKNQESPEQEANGGAKQDLSALQNHNLLIALAHGNTSGASQFAMPVSFNQTPQ